MSKKKIYVIILLLISLFSNNIFSINLNKQTLINPFPSETNLKNFTKIQNVDLYDKEELSNIQISLITITPGDQIYSWFGHSAILIENNDKKPVVYDYGIFSFDSENFYENFLLGKMYYLVLPSYANSRLIEPIKDNRKISKVELNLEDNQKIDIMNFLIYNSKEENRTYLYDFYYDNCATRIRDIINWTENGDFKKWATNQYTSLTFRNLSTKELYNSRFVNWVLNSFLGKDCDRKITTWETMFLPEYLEKSIIEYNELNKSQTFIANKENSTDFNDFNKVKHYLLFYSIFAIVLGFIGVFLKTLKQDHEINLFGIYNVIISLFLLIISIFITFFVFKSNIQATWNNENILFLNPIIFFIMLILSIKTIYKKETSYKNLIIFDKFTLIYSFYIIIFLVLKNIIPSVLSQQNYNIILPILLFYSIQSLINHSSN